MTSTPDQDADWTYVSRTLIWVRLISLAIALAIPAIALLVIGVTVSRWVLIGVVAVVIAAVWGSWVIVRQVTAHAWMEREEDLIIKRGRMWRSMTVVPYGRMQYVEVESGPLERSFGIAKVQLHTASPGSDAAISGVPKHEAERLRDRLASRGEAQLAGL